MLGNTQGRKLDRYVPDYVVFALDGWMRRIRSMMIFWMEPGKDAGESRQRNVP